ncbi:uncharacterized protein LOC131326827 [Rhododendron vialii]|uniref:uncharacterized protein LOC131326827 n=1 Tax=Rhododendron vialii TaxID=182163 RepID=UPI00265F613C|nr:uncharacterized protein LOC131326827 [Rhododendron vialii]
MLASLVTGTQGDDFGENLSKSLCSYFSSFLFLLFLSIWSHIRNFRISIPSSLQIFEAPNLPPLPRSKSHQPEFHEFHLETMERANHSAQTSTIASIAPQNC